MRLDGRIMVRLVSPDEVPDASPVAVLIRIGTDPAGKKDQDGSGWATVLFLPETAIMSHAAACRCCSGRTGFSDALGQLFARRARMELPLFNLVVVQVVPDRIHDLVTILCEDGTVSGRFRRES